MRLFVWCARVLAPLSLVGMALGAASGCTTEAACFNNCNGIDGTEHGGNENANGGVAGSIVIVMGGDNAGPDLGGSFSTGGRIFEDAGTPCDNVDLQTDLNNCGTCGNVCIFTGADALCVKGSCEIGECHPDRYDIDKD